MSLTIKDSLHDEATGLLLRAAFLDEVRKGQSPGSIGTQVRRGCLLILNFPVLKHIQAVAGNEAVNGAFRNLLGIVETRHRSRDTMGRIGDHSLCIFLRRCKEQDAGLIAEQYVALLRDAVIESGEHRAAMDLHYRIIPLDWRGRRTRQGISKIVKASGDADRMVTAIQTLANSGEHEAGQLLYLAPRRDVSDRAQAVLNSQDHTAKVAGADYRLKPGILLKHRPLVCCFRVSPLGLIAPTGPISKSALFDAVLDSLAMGNDNGRPLIESQMVVPVSAMQLNSESSLWLKEQCRSRRVAPSDVCLSLRVDTITQDLRSSLPAIRSLNRQGIMLMLEGVSSAAQFTAIQKLANFDYLLISAKVLQASLLKIRARKELESLIVLAQEQQRQICAAGIDSPALMAHAQQLQVEIGFGRECGRSEPFPGTLRSG
ncbi:EAL domain-containing protein [Granulosicoccus antarcticus]|uniref:EAL domain-containing protein n=1 Tax=Granulosicoccus antarcticus IMCC3135 TaxID=1192854 RepID=A0A2Z2NVW5_9GAMM|nr:EAL domain-containing protein [Granulosicoccus antarcticus]ASJ75606.1 hypothetical protein IMCC3135_27765 [Granulosicoccus antarcticus IMCC3135]